MNLLLVLNSKFEMTFAIRENIFSEQDSICPRVKMYFFSCEFYVFIMNSLFLKLALAHLLCIVATLY